MPIIKSSQLDTQKIDFSKPYPYANGSGANLFI